MSAQIYDSMTGNMPAPLKLDNKPVIWSLFSPLKAKVATTGADFVLEDFLSLSRVLEVTGPI